MLLNLQVNITDCRVFLQTCQYVLIKLRAIYIISISAQTTFYHIFYIDQYQENLARAIIAYRIIMPSHNFSFHLLEQACWRQEENILNSIWRNVLVCRGSMLPPLANNPILWAYLESELLEPSTHITWSSACLRSVFPTIQRSVAYLVAATQPWYEFIAFRDIVHLELFRTRNSNKK